VKRFGDEEVAGRRPHASGEQSPRGPPRGGN
jgi:hypothetical protein